MLGIIAAVWAVVPATSTLTFRLSFSRFDWLVIWAGALAIHVLVFEHVLRTVHAYPDFGPWRWGLDKNGAMYLLFLSLAIYIYLRSRKTRLSRRSLPLFEKLATSLLHARKFEELGQLLELHLKTVVDIASVPDLRERLSVWIRPESPPRPWEWEFTNVAAPPLPNFFLRSFRKVRSRLSQEIQPSETVRRDATNVVKMLLASRGLVAYLARAYPYLCLDVMKVVETERLAEEFQDNFFEALLADDGSVFFAELKNNQNLAGADHRLHIPDENQLISFYLADVGLAKDLAVYRSLGEAMLSRISYDRALVDHLNGPLLTYSDVGRFHCPIDSGIRFFRIMVLEGLHQRLPDHLWLHYLPHFTNRILENAREAVEEDEWEEFATPFSYLLYEIVDAASDWVEEAIKLTRDRGVVMQDQLEGDHVYIAFEAAKALGGVMEAILSSEKVSHRLKEELLTMVVRTYSRVKQAPNLVALLAAIKMAMVRPFSMRGKRTYLLALDATYAEVDYILRMETEDFEEAIQNALAE